jgi:hypothetical protein
MPVWRKIGRIFEPASGLHPKLLSHAANPLAVHVEGGLYRVYYSGRDGSSRSSVGSFDFDMRARRIVAINQRPEFEHGPCGSFYADGVSIGCIYHPKRRGPCILFMGWQNPPGSHWRGDIGRLRLGRDRRLTLDADTPFIGATTHDPISLSYPAVIESDGGYLMWYGSTIKWDAGNGEMLHVIRGARSTDGESWVRAPELDLPFEVGIAQAFSRPAVVRNVDGSLDMWFSYRSGTGTPYRIGRACSADGTGWELRLAESGIDVSESGWDSEMIEYPHVFHSGGERFLLYNGNGYGKTGIGLAVWVGP